MRGMVAMKVINMFNAGVIEPASTDRASPVVLVPKTDGSLQFCMNYRLLNANKAADSFPLPQMNDCIDSLGDAAEFKTLGYNYGHWQISVAPKDRDKTTFTRHMSTLWYNLVPL